jgi:putative addiction module component (TIGR02574 family)
MTNRAITEQALHLSTRERADLAHKLLESLDDVPPAEAEKLWAATAVRRAREIDEGKVEMVSAEELERRVGAKLK